VREALADCYQIEASRQAAPVIGQLAAGTQVGRGKVRLGKRSRHTLVAQEIGQIAERRSGDRELPIEHRGYAPSPAGTVDQQVPFVEIAVDQAGFGRRASQAGSPQNCPIQDDPEIDIVSNAR
jgi:hypothetical protein